MSIVILPQRIKKKLNLVQFLFDGFFKNHVRTVLTKSIGTIDVVSTVLLVHDDIQYSTVKPVTATSL